MQKQIIVIGGGPAGIEAAKAAATAGARVILVSNAPIGGRAGWHSLLPSKVWLTASDSLALFWRRNGWALLRIRPFSQTCRKF
ncbi:MAG: FAD-dependent oxidoreductase [Chloroflexota bacterium]